MKLINKLTLGHLTVSLFVIVVAFAGISAINHINFTFNEIAEQTIPTIKAVEDARTAGLKITCCTSEFAFISPGNRTNGIALDDEEKEHVESAIKQYDAAISRYEELVNKYFPDEKDLLENIKNSGERLKNISAELIALKEKGASGSIVLEKRKEFEAAQQEFQKAINDAIAYEDKEFAERKQNVEHAIATSVKNILIAGLLTFIIAIVLGVNISKSISKPIIKLKNAAVKLGKGELDTRVEIKSRDEVGILATCFNQMADRLEHDITERKQAEEALRESEERYHRLVDYSPYGIAIHSERKLVYVNLAGAKILGASNPEELVGKPVLQIIHPDYHEIVKERIRMEEEGKMAPLIEEKFLRLDGSPVDVEMVSIPVTYKGKLAMYGVFRDITERKRAEEALKESEERYRTLAEGANDSIFIIERDNRIRYVNSFAAKQVGLVPEELVGRRLIEFFPPEEFERMKNNMQKIFQTGEPLYSEEIITYINRKYWQGTWLIPIKDTAGEVDAVMGITRDITERKQAEDALRKSELLLSEAERIAHLGNWEWDIQTNVLHWSDETYRILGYSPGEITPYYDTFLNAIHPEDRKHVKEAVADALAKKRPYGIEHRMVQKDGSVVAVYSQGEVTLDSSGKPIRMIGTIQDITERTKLEELRLENERLVYANRARSDFLAFMSHELRTPLNAVLGFSELMKQTTELDEKQRHYLENIITSGNSLLGIIDRILDLTRTGAEKQELIIEKFDAAKALDGVIDLFRENAENKNVTLKKEFDPQLEFIEADRIKFNQILFNLIDNAVKFSKKEGGTVTITTRKMDDTAQVSVSDTGIGIKENDMRNLFTRFWQADSGTARKYGGTGLGLAITKQLVELHGGKIRAKSKFGIGSTFTLVLPLHSRKEKNK